jgi:hypothetical protein
VETIDLPSVAGGKPVYPVKTTDLPSVAGGKPVYPVETTDLPSVAEKLYHNNYMEHFRQEFVL